MPTVYLSACATDTANCSGNNRITLAVDQAFIQQTAQPSNVEPIDPQRVGDMYALFLAFVGVLVVVWGLKQLLRLFSLDTEKD